MDLSADLFGDITDALRAAPQDEEVSASAGQRRKPRTSIEATATLIPLYDRAVSASPLTVQVRDVSCAGIGFLHDRKMDLDEPFALLLTREGEAPAVLLCAVAFWQPLARDVYAIGARFTRVLRDGGDPPLYVDLTRSPTTASVQPVTLQRRAAS